MPDHLRVHFREELQLLEVQALSALDVLVGSLDRAMEALSYQDVELAAMVIRSEHEVTDRCRAVHHGVLSLLALQAPVARDLRTIAAFLHVVKHVERMGNQVVSVAKLIPLSGHTRPEDPELLRMVGNMGRRARSQVLQCKQAFTMRDVELAEDLVRQDVAINLLNRAVFQRAVEFGTDEDTREWAMHMMLIARALERLGDNAVDIGEQVAFVVTGLFREFSDASSTAYPRGHGQQA